MAEMKPHLALTVSDVERSVPFYRALFDAEPAKVKPGYVKFEPADPGIVLTLTKASANGPRGLQPRRHQGVVDDDVLATRLRLQQAGLATFDEMDTELLLRAPGQDLGHRPRRHAVGGVHGARRRGARRLTDRAAAVPGRLLRVSAATTQPELRTPQQLYEDWEQSHWAAQDIDLRATACDWAGSTRASASSCTGS